MVAPLGVSTWCPIIVNFNVFDETAASRATRKAVASHYNQRNGNPGIVNPGIEKAPNLHKNCTAGFFKISIILDFFGRLIGYHDRSKHKHQHRLNIASH